MPVPTITLLDASSTVMESTYEVLTVDIEREVNRIPRCNLKLLDGDLSSQSFPISDNAFFEPGAELTVKLKYEGKPETEAVVFAGLVVRHGLSLNHKGSILSLELMDKAVALTQPRKSVLFEAKTDYEVIELIAKAGGLTMAADPPTTAPKHPQLLQYEATDWDFILARAQAQGLVLALTDGVLAAPSVTTDGSTTHTFTYGKDDIYGVDVEADSLYQPASVEAVGWDPKEQKIAEGKGAPQTNPTGDLDAAKTAEALGFKPTLLRHLAPVDAKELKAWADGRLARARRSMIRGRITIPGDGAIALLDAIELDKLGKRFSGPSTITGIRHRVTKSGWTTDLQFGFSPEQLTQEPRPTPTAAGLLPGASSLQIGVVDAFVEDPLAGFRLKVIIPGLDDKKKGSVWARLTSPDAGPERGLFFRPEVGDEVVIAFINGDPRQAVVLGSLHSAKNPPPVDFGPIDADNTFKGIFSRSGVIFGIDDVKPLALLSTPTGNQLVLDDDGGQVRLADSNGNSIVLDAKGITITSAKDVTIDGSAGGVTILGGTVEAK